MFQVHMLPIGSMAKAAGVLNCVPDR
ncbi:hypothetical protein BOSEA31B_20766 [Hyphomicrobiales bacterium]|nr:hypothetical protein BOSEA31B_20766 [Hyphomicrobiales bacterium]CAH1702737.1 hypothetical protein BOSEA1005_30609 [Hyphomicrobiales bacterium]